MRKLLASVAVGALLVASSACSSDPDEAGPAASSPAVTTQNTDESSSPQSPSDSQTTPKDADLATHTFKVGAQDAFDMGLNEVGDGFVHGLEIDWDSKLSAWIWEVKILAGTTDHEVEINADTGEIVKTEGDSTDDTEKPIDLNDPMTFDVAKDKALQKRDGRIESWKLEYDDGQFEYQFDIVVDGKSDEVTVNATTGETTLD